MASLLTRLEQRKGVWSLVTYALSSAVELTEIQAQPTNIPSKEDPRVVGFGEYPHPSLSAPERFQNDTFLADGDQPVIFASVIRRNDGTDTGGKSKLDYPLKRRPG